MSTVCHNVAEITCDRSAHTRFVLPVPPQMFRCRGGGLSRAHSAGPPPCTPRQWVTTRELFFWVDVIFLQVALGSLPLLLPLRDTSFCGFTQGRLGGWDETVARVLAAFHGLVVMEAVSLVCQLFGALVLVVNAAPYFRWGDAGQHVEVFPD